MLSEKNDGVSGKLDELLAKVASDSQIIEACTILAKVNLKTRGFSETSHDMWNSFCDYMRESQNLDRLIAHFVDRQRHIEARMACGRVVEESLSHANLAHIVTLNRNGDVVDSTLTFNKNPDQRRMAISIFEKLCMHNPAPEFFALLITRNVLAHIAGMSVQDKRVIKTLRHAAVAVANIALMADNHEGQRRILQDQVPKEFFWLGSMTDDALVRHYACLAIAIFATFKKLACSGAKSRGFGASLRRSTNFDRLIAHFIDQVLHEKARMTCGRVLEESLDFANLHYIVEKDWHSDVIEATITFDKNPDQRRMSMSIFEKLTTNGPETFALLIHRKVPAHVRIICEQSNRMFKTLRNQ
ncbi:hypothetical protein PMAYCL1PPCAC_20306 [Pristionchus mayeri]|uniref:Uncharacterized protein n=1 Tax=Pristionchus mayeri TaxID=1317129 RepID=A0AAN5CT15_9BILA|nr:hypothetical protein PMAYCL1PPCAC_20306 [Pristionchus mayeri]